ncbi:DUF305 domain-containing protein [Streptomyces griseosporeus]|uniref:DUF305 domain-containing protein n=1 Tax=Streptomyces griseosporeus TaxID=1910 RepID=UPI0036FB97EE
MSKTRMSAVRRAGLAAVAVTAALTLAACGGGSGGHEEHAAAAPTASAATTAGAHNAQDVAFAQGMIPHHRQALDMAGRAADKASSAQVKDLASRIQKAQDPEIKTMSGWLAAWGEDVPQADNSSMPGMDHSEHTGGHSEMPGMMGDEDMAKLEKASGKAFDTLFLTMMIEHHQGAVQMATTEKAKGQYGPAKAMAGDIITAQNAEIQEMKKLLGQ